MLGVGWACQPSPALITEPATCWAIRYGEPDSEWRTTMTSAPRACKVRIVSTSDSCFVTELVDAVTLIVSAERFFAANSKDTRVLVLAS